MSPLQELYLAYMEAQAVYDKALHACLHEQEAAAAFVATKHAGLLGEASAKLFTAKCAFEVGLLVPEGEEKDD